MEQISISEKRGANYTLLEISGSVNAYTIADLQNRTYTIIQENNLVLDMSNVFELDSSGMALLMGLFNAGKESEKKLYLLNMSPPAQKTVLETGFIDAFNVINSVTEVT